MPLHGFCKENIFKLYYFDIRMLNSALQLDPKAILSYDFDNYKGFLAENFVALELISSGEKNLVAWHEATAEVEFVLEKNGGIIPIEVKAGSVTQAKSLKVFIEKYNSSNSYILSANIYSAHKNRAMKIPIYAAGLLKSLINKE